MRILHWNDGYYPRIGGTETLVRDLCHVQQAAGHQVTVVGRALPGSPAEEVMDGIPVWRRPVLDEDLIHQPGLLTRQIKACAEYKQRFQPDIIHIHGCHMAGWLHLLSRSAAPCPAVLTLHAPLHLPAALQRRVLEEVEILAAVSASMLAAFSPQLKTRSAPSHVVHNGLALPLPAPAPPREVTTALCLGRMVNDKGFDIALRALALVPHVRLIMAGDGIELPHLQKLAADLGLDHRVDFRGWVHPTAVPDLIASSDVVFMPSRWEEPFGLVALQAAQMSRPIIASRIGGLPEIVLHGTTGFLVPPEDPTAIAAALQSLCDHPDMVARMGSHARSHAEQEFSIASCAAAYKNLYTSAIAAIRAS